MNSDLESIAAADEESRARVSFVRQHQSREMEAAAGQRDAAIRKRRSAVEEELQRELDAITAEGERELVSLRAVHERDREQLSAIGERELERAAQLWARIIREGAP